MIVTTKVEELIPYEDAHDRKIKNKYYTEKYPSWRATISRTTSHTWWERWWHKKEDVVESIEILWNGCVSSYNKMWWADEPLKEVPSGEAMVWVDYLWNLQRKQKADAEEALVSSKWKRRQPIPVARKVEHHDGPDKNCYDYGCTGDCPAAKP